MKEIANIEDAMDLQASEEVHEDYQDMLPDFKLTFEAAYAEHAEEADDTSARIDDCMDIFLAIEMDAIAAFPSEVAAEAAAVEADAK
jgi:adenosylmethionine-8-amino-7-oxononanoate aminotransferase